MGGELISMGMGMRCVLLREDWLFNGLMLRVRERMIERMVPGILQMTLPVLTRPGFDLGLCSMFLRF
jgi:hypothetical protein